MTLAVAASGVELVERLGEKKSSFDSGVARSPVSRALAVSALGLGLGLGVHRLECHVVAVKTLQSTASGNVLNFCTVIHAVTSAAMGNGSDEGVAAFSIAHNSPGDICARASLSGSISSTQSGVDERKARQEGKDQRR